MSGKRPGRRVVIGKNSAVWRRLAPLLDSSEHEILPLSHAELDEWQARPNDVVWIFSYSRRPEENSRLIQRLSQQPAARFCYLSTATANVAEQTTCYRYPAVKAQAEAEAIARLGATIVRVGIVYGDAEELPGGTSAVTSLAEIAEALTSEQPRGRIDLFDLMCQPFGSEMEARLFAAYGHLMMRVTAYPCTLRPVDLLLSKLGYRWYGYVYVSNMLLQHRHSHG